MASKDLVRTFTHCELYFAAPSLFNDPFDCCPPFSTTYTESDLLYYYRKKNIPSECSETTRMELEAKLREFVYSKLNDEHFKSEMADHFMKICRDVNRALGVLCLSEVPDDILMWSHYADGHRGIVLQFDKSRLERAFSKCWCEKVDYNNNILTLEEINSASPDAEKFARLVLLKKEDRWKYENEWRIIIDPSLNKHIPHCRIDRFPKEALTGVIFGAEMSPEDKYAVQMWLKENNHQAQIYQAIRETGSYSLKIKPPL